MPSIWVDSLTRSFDDALDMLTAAVRECPAELWEASLWRVDAPGPEFQFLGADWMPITDAAQRTQLAEKWVERRSTPWSVAWHALETLDYDLNGEFGPWMPPAPFAGHPHWRDLPSLPSPWSQAEIVDYIDHAPCGYGTRLPTCQKRKRRRRCPRPTATTASHTLASSRACSCTRPNTHLSSGSSSPTIGSSCATQRRAQARVVLRARR